MQGQISRKCKRVQASRDNNSQKSQLEKHINNATKNCYATLIVLRKIKRYTPLSVHKQLAESLILSKLDYCNELLFEIPKYMKQQLQKVQNTAAGFVLNKYGNINDVAIDDENVPNHLRLTQKVPAIYEATTKEF